MGNSEQLGENIIHDQKMEGGPSKKEQSAGIKRGGKIQKKKPLLIQAYSTWTVDIGKQYLDCFKEMGKELRRSWARISVTILIEQKRHRLLCPRRNVPDFGRVFLMLKYIDITQNTYVQS
jgi:hypothetical protein